MLETCIYAELNLSLLIDLYQAGIQDVDIPISADKLP